MPLPDRSYSSPAIHAIMDDLNVEYSCITCKLVTFDKTISRSTYRKIIIMSASLDKYDGKHQKALTDDGYSSHSEYWHGLFILPSSSQNISFKRNGNFNVHENDIDRDLTTTNSDESNRVGENEGGGNGIEELYDCSDAGEHNTTFQFRTESNDGRGE